MYWSRPTSLTMPFAARCFNTRAVRKTSKLRHVCTEIKNTKLVVALASVSNYSPTNSASALVPSASCRLPFASSNLNLSKMPNSNAVRSAAVRVGSPHPIRANCSPGFSNSWMSELAAAMIFWRAFSSPDSVKVLPLDAMSSSSVVELIVCKVTRR
jgi:hypothetical protein